MLKLQTFTFNAFAENTYVLSDDTQAGIIIDPGCYDRHEQATLKAYVAQEGLNIEKVVNTHCHIDHVLGNYWATQTFDAPLYIPEQEFPVLKAIPAYAGNYGFPQYQEAKPTGYLKEKGKLTFGKSSLDILFVPGHSPGHLAFYSKKSGICIGGDVLFQGSIGRTDLPGGNFDQLIRSIHTQLFPLPDETVVYCGHGPSTTIGQEKKTNPFCAL